MDSMTLAILLLFGGTFFFLIIGAPIAISVGISSFAAMMSILPFNGALTTSANRMFSGLDNFALLAIPFFILAGNIMNNGGIAIRLINFSKIFSRFLPGALAQTNIVSNMLFGAISGSGVASAAAVGGVIAPIEKREGYDRAYSAAVNIASAPTGMIIPPSNTIIVYATVAGSVSVSALFMAGYLPGILWGLGVMVVAAIMAKKRGYVSTGGMTIKDCITVTVHALPSLSLIFVVIGGILGGYFTATEASAIAVVYALILSVFYRSLSLKQLPQILLETAKMSAIVVFMLATSTIMSWVMSFTKMPSAIAQTLLELTSNPIMILLIINVVLLLIGAFMDPMPAVLIFTPIFLPICQQLGMNAVQFGIILVFNLSLGTITPPVGPILFTGCKVGNIEIEDVVKTLLPFFLVITIVLMLVTYIPAISMWLPTTLGLVR